MMSCREATRLLSERQERRLSLRERLALGFHLLICHLCRKFGRNVEQLHGLLNKTGEQEADHVSGLTPESRQRLQSALDKELG